MRDDTSLQILLYGHHLITTFYFEFDLTFTPGLFQ
jgi:hypothetical protein